MDRKMAITVFKNLSAAARIRLWAQSDFKGTFQQFGLSSYAIQEAFHKKDKEKAKEYHG